MGLVTAGASGDTPHPVGRQVVLAEPHARCQPTSGRTAHFLFVTLNKYVVSFSDRVAQFVQENRHSEE